MEPSTEIISALRLFFQPGDVFEIRILDAITADYQRPHPEFGYFDYDNIENVPKALERIRHALGIYFTVNPVKPALHARAYNRIRQAKQGENTKDADILCRRWLLIDCDAKRPSGISSSDDEHEKAIDKALEIKDGLASLCWADPIMTDSGNGAQLMYRVDLPADDNELTQKVIKRISVVGDDCVDVDLTVHNPARIWRLPGTMNCKGDPTAERPHRRANLYKVPDVLNIVTEEQLRAILEEPTTESEPQTPAFIGEPDINGLAGEGPDLPPRKEFKLDDWISKHCPELTESLPWNGGRKWIFPICPFNEAHNNRSAILIEQPNGAIGFTCHHNGCSGKDWKALREMRDPEALRITTPKMQSKVIVYEPEIENEELEQPKPWRDIKNSDIRKALEGTFLGQLTELYSNVTIPPLPLEASLLKAIVTVGCALSERGIKQMQGTVVSLNDLMSVGSNLARLRINTAGGQVCNVYAMLAANSACGKDIGNLLDIVTSMYQWNLGTSGSAEGIAEALKESPNGMISISEFMNWIDEKHWQHKAASFLTEAFSKGFFSHNFSSRSGKSGKSACDFCYPNIMANIQPEVFENVVSKMDVSTGFLGRFLYCKMPEFFGDPNNFDVKSVIDQMVTIIDVFRKKSGVVEVPNGYSKKLSEMFKENSPTNMHPVWRRLVNEYMPRFAVMLSVNLQVKTQGECVILTEDCWIKAEKMVLWFFAHAEKMLVNVDDISQYAKTQEKIMCKILHVIKKYDKGDGVILRVISHYAASGTGTTAKQRMELIAEMVERNWIKASGAVGMKGTTFKVYCPPPGRLR